LKSLDYSLYYSPFGRVYAKGNPPDSAGRVSGQLLIPYRGVVAVVKSNLSEPRQKPGKPYEGYPLFAHPSGQWAKKIRKRLLYFGSWRTDPEGTAALETFNREWPYLKEGRTPPTVDVSGGCTLRQLCNAFLRSKEDKLNADDLSPRTFRDYFRTCQGLIDAFGKDRRVDDLRPDDFRAFRANLAKRFGVTSLKNEINRVCIVFNYAHDNNLIPKPVSYGSNFDRPSAKALRRERNAAGPRLFERDEILRLLKAAGKELKAMILLGVNCGFGNTDVASLPLAALDLERGWVTFPRPKTEIHRRCPLWQETLAALRDAIAGRPVPTDPAGKGLCFLTRLGRPWVRVKRKAGTDDPVFVPVDAVGQEFGKRPA
jgi:integrase